MNIFKIVKSNLSSYGSSSLKQLQRISDHDISKIQKKDFNIITLNKGNNNPFYSGEKLK